MEGGVSVSGWCLLIKPLEVLVIPKHAAETDALERAVEIMQNFGFIRTY